MEPTIEFPMVNSASSTSLLWEFLEICSSNRVDPEDAKARIRFANWKKPDPTDAPPGTFVAEKEIDGRDYDLILGGTNFPHVETWFCYLSVYDFDTDLTEPNFLQEFEQIEGFMGSLDRRTESDSIVVGAKYSAIGPDGFPIRLTAEFTSYSWTLNMASSRPKKPTVE
tara:strand:- start:5543 stop:6046 length:504 start_codon:yes stop_codon:yes gene_type:complete